jgi:hypothetical protein
MSDIRARMARFRDDRKEELSYYVGGNDWCAREYSKHLSTLRHRPEEVRILVETRIGALAG